MGKKTFLCMLGLAIMSSLGACTNKPKIDGSYSFIIYEKDTDNSNLSDNRVIVSYEIEYSSCQTVADTLIKRDSNYYFSGSSPNYLTLVDSAYGLSLTTGFVSEYSSEIIDLSWSYTAVNGVMATTGIGETPLTELKNYGLVIDGWR